MKLFGFRGVSRRPDAGREPDDAHPSDSEFTDAENKLAQWVQWNTPSVMCEVGPPTTRGESQQRLTVEDMRHWGADRRIRSSLVMEVLDRNLPVQISGAVIEGPLFLSNRQVRMLRLEKCFIRGEVFANGITADSLLFANCVFEAHVEFVGSAVTQSFVCRGCTFVRPVWFRDSTWSAAFFDRTEFLEMAWFDHVIVTETATFAESWFRAIDFRFSRFLRDATFTRAVFAGEAKFFEAVARTWDFTDAHFDSADPGPWIGESANLSGTTFQQRGHVTIIASRYQHAG